MPEIATTMVTLDMALAMKVHREEHAADFLANPGRRLIKFYDYSLTQTAYVEPWVLFIFSGFESADDNGEMLMRASSRGSAAHQFMDVLAACRLNGGHDAVETIDLFRKAAPSVRAMMVERARQTIMKRVKE